MGKGRFKRAAGFLQKRLEECGRVKKDGRSIKPPLVIKAFKATQKSRSFHNP